jgi:hypothetical protein
MTTLTDAQLTKLAEKIFIMRDRDTTRLPKPVTTGSAAFKTALNWIGTDPRFKDAGIGVIDFTNDPMHPSVWLNSPADTPFRIGSASKIAMMLAAVQLRLDVRQIFGLAPQVISSPAEFDKAFRDPKLWAKAKAPQSQMQQIAGTANAPLISKIFDFDKSPIDFAGPDPDKQTVPANQQKIVDKLPADGELAWETPSLTFSERLWLTGCLSDNVAATICVSDIGVPYIKAVQRAYGLANHPSNGMHLLASSGYATIPRRTTPPAPKPPRQLTHVEPIPVNDFWFNEKSRKFDDKMSWVPGSAAALTAYMIALKTDAFADPGTGLVGGLTACQTIRNNLADGGSHAIQSFLVKGENVDNANGIASVARVNTAINKIGILKKSDGAKLPILCEFVYVETEEFAAPAHGRNKMKYAVIATGLTTTSSSTLAPHRKSADLGVAVHKSLLTL